MGDVDEGRFLTPLDFEVLGSTRFSLQIFIKMSLAKPKLRGLLHSKTKIDFLAALGVSIVAALGYKFSVREARKSRWEEWKANYDGKADLARMMKAGVFQGVNRAIEEGTMTADYQWIEVDEE